MLAALQWPVATHWKAGTAKRLTADIRHQTAGLSLDAVTSVARLTCSRLAAPGRMDRY